MDIRPGRWAGRCRASRRRSCAATRTARSCVATARSTRSPTDRGRRAGAAARMAVDVPRLPARGRALPRLLRRRLVPHRRPRPPRRRRLLLVRRPGRRRHQVGRPPDRPVRGGERADGAPGRRRGGRDRQARSGRRRAGQGVRRPCGPATRRATSCAIELIGLARKRLGAAVAPKELAFAEHLPKTRSGKIVRRLLRARESSASPRATFRRWRTRWIPAPQ